MLLSIAKGSDIVVSLSLEDRYSASLMRSDVRLCQAPCICYSKIVKPGIS